MTITEFLGKQSRPVLVALGTLLFVFVSAGDYLTHAIHWLEFSPFYLVPVSFFTWFVGKRSGVAAAVTSVIIGFFITLRQIPGSIAYWDLVIRFALYVSSAFMISQLKMLYDRERQLSRIDPLTKIENRRAFFEAASRAKSYSERNGVPLSIAYLDVDGFKQLNDRFGHRTGDRILTAAADAIRKALRPTDLAARLGGDEFAILLPATDKESAALVLSRVCHAIDRAMQKGGWPATVSIGVESFFSPFGSIPEMLQAADAAMYAVKQSRKDGLPGRDLMA